MDGSGAVGCRVGDGVGALRDNEGAGGGKENGWKDCCGEWSDLRCEGVGLKGGRNKVFDFAFLGYGFCGI